MRTVSANFLNGLLLTRFLNVVHACTKDVTLLGTSCHVHRTPWRRDACVRQESFHDVPEPTPRAIIGLSDPLALELSQASCVPAGVRQCGAASTE
jgi:hypothetical protein